MTRSMSLACALVLLCSSTVLANNSWRVEGRLRETLNAWQGTTQPLSGVDVRLQVRWSDRSLCPQIGLGPSQPCPFSPVGWSTDTTDSAGRFSCDSLVFPDPINAYDREFRVEVRTTMNPTWSPVGTIQARSGPTNMNGPRIPPPVHTVTLDTITLDLFPEPPIEWTSAEEDGEDDGDDASTHTPTIAAADPCHGPTGLDLPRPDFGFVPLQGAGINTSPDGLVRIQMRQSTGGDSRARMLRITVLLRNSGNGDYSASEPCVAKVRMARNEGPGFYTNTAAGAVANSDGEITPIRVNNNRMIQFDAVLRGTGPDGPGSGWNEGYEYVRFEIVLDPEQRFLEGNEADNRIGPYCYHAPSNSFVAAGNCPQPASARSDRSDRPAGKDEKKSKQGLRR